MNDAASIRKRFAEEVCAKSNVPSARLLDAFARVRRERLLGEGPWEVGVLGQDGSMAYQRTPTSNPAEVYRDAVIAIDPVHSLNNEEPSSLAVWIDALDPKPGDHMVHVGFGTGYYTAIVQSWSAPPGRLTGFEIDASLAARARASLQSYVQVVVSGGESPDLPLRSVDAKFVNCAVTHPAHSWLSWMRVRRRLLTVFPVPAAPSADGIGFGAMYLAERRHDDVAPRHLSAVGIYPGIGQRSEALNQALLAKDPNSWLQVRSLRTDSQQSNPSCWRHTSECCMSLRRVPPAQKRAAHRGVPTTRATFPTYAKLSRSCTSLVRTTAARTPS